jgi:hypothetical protein
LSTPTRPEGGIRTVTRRPRRIPGISTFARNEHTGALAMRGRMATVAISVSAFPLASPRYAYWIKLVRRRLNSSSVIDPDFFS